jgi:DNA-binding transcriptional regulator GbsR (MarR family)
MKNENRKWVEWLAVTIVRAVNVSGIPQTQTVLYSRLWLRPGMPWTISALAEATSLDRASVRAHLKNFPEHHLVRTDYGFVLTPAGERHTYRLTLQFYRAIETEDRHKMKGFFSTKYAGQSPMRTQAEFVVDLDRCTRRIPHSAFDRVSHCAESYGPIGP